MSMSIPEIMTLEESKEFYKECEELNRYCEKLSKEGKIEKKFYFFAQGTLKSPEPPINTGKIPIFNLH